LVLSVALTCIVLPLNLISNIDAGADPGDGGVYGEFTTARGAGGA
jgi:hypothetical protein